MSLRIHDGPGSKRRVDAPANGNADRQGGCCTGPERVPGLFNHSQNSNLSFLCGRVPATEFHRRSLSDNSMSMIQSGYLFDWDGYRRELDGPKRDPSRLEDWIDPLEALRRRLRGQSLPEWRISLDEKMEEEREELLSPETRIATLEQVRDLHFLAITDFCRGRANDYEWWWDTLKTGLGKIIGKETADIAVL